jgi:hypothetical protein
MDARLRSEDLEWLGKNRKTKRGVAAHFQIGLPAVTKRRLQPCLRAFGFLSAKLAEAGLEVGWKLLAKVASRDGQIVEKTEADDPQRLRAQIRAGQTSSDSVAPEAKPPCGVEASAKPAQPASTASGL